MIFGRIYRLLVAWIILGNLARGFLDDSETELVRIARAAVLFSIFMSSGRHLLITLPAERSKCQTKKSREPFR